MERRAPLDRARQLRELPRRSLRPREHGAGGLEHGARPSARGHARADGRADRSARRARRSVPRAAHAALARVALAAGARASRRSSSWRSARCPCSGSDAAISTPRRRPRCSRIGYLAYPWTATSAAASIHPVTFAIPLFLFCIWFLDTERLGLFAVFALLAMSTGELMGLPIAALGIWYALARRERWRRRPRRRSAAWRGRSSRSTSWCRTSPASTASSTASTTSVGGSPAGVAEDALHRSGRCARRARSKATTSRISSGSGFRSSFLFVLSPGLAAVALPQLARERALGLPLDDRPSVSQRRGGDPVSHRRDGVRDRADTARHDTGLPPAAVLVCSATLAIFVAPWPRAVGSVPLGGRRVRSRRSRRRARAMRSRSCPADAPVSCVELPPAHTCRRRRYVYSVPLLGRADWVVVDVRDPWTVRPDSPILTRHPKVVQGVVARSSATRAG